jgi:hypothetical protein
MANENDRVGDSIRSSADDLHALPPLRYRRGGRGKERWHKRPRIAPLELSGNRKPRARPNQRAVDEDEQHSGARYLGGASHVLAPTPTGNSYAAEAV